MPRLVIAGTHSGVGKTTCTLALLAALKERGRRIQAFKVGPDFIDTSHHSAITGSPSRNLDGWMLGRDLNRHIFQRASLGTDLSIIEGMMGLFDGSSPRDDIGSTAELAKQLNAPLLLVIDGSGLARSAAAIALGYTRFDPDLRMGGILFNRVSGEGHYSLLKQAVEMTVDVPVVGYLKPDAEVSIPDRHLGIMTAIEQGATALYARLGEAARETIDLDQIERMASSADVFQDDVSNIRPMPEKHSSVEADRICIGVAYDPAFCFYYSDNLDFLKQEGAELCFFSPLRDPHLPDADLLYFGGGYPELYGAALSANHSMKTAIKAHAERGGTIYAECGGLMYLTETIQDFHGAQHAMVGVFPAKTVMHRSQMTLGYREFLITRPCLLGQAGARIRGHEFHYSTVTPHGHVQYGGTLANASGQGCGDDGLLVGNTMALYTHLHFGSQPSVARALVDAARDNRIAKRREGLDHDGEARS